MVELLKPVTGGFMRPFGCGWFIREFLMGHGPEGRPRIDPNRGACQADVFHHYKLALHTAYAEDATAWENDRRIKAGKEQYTELEYAERVDWHLRGIPYKLVKCRYHSFVMYFNMLKKLKWVEASGEEEVSTPQDYYEGFEPRRYYRLTQKGIEAPDDEWSNPHRALYPQFDLEYYRKKRKTHNYTRKSPTLSRRARGLAWKTRVQPDFNPSFRIFSDFGKRFPQPATKDGVIALYALYIGSPYREASTPAPEPASFLAVSLNC